MEVIRGQVPDDLALSGSGSGSGYGYGYGSGDGDGSGDGNGSGYAYGSGSGDGDGSGYGYGSGSGDGDGYGYGSGDGDGDGDGNLVGTALATLSPAQREDPRTLALWKSNADGTPANGGRDMVAQVGLVQHVDGPLELCGPHALHATLQPEKWKGDRVWIVALEGEVIGDAAKLGALKREIIAEVPT